VSESTRRKPQGLIIGHLHSDSKMYWRSMSIGLHHTNDGGNPRWKNKSIADHSRMDEVVEASRCQNPDMPGSGKPKNFSFNSLQVGIPAEEATGLIGHFHMDSKMNGVSCHSVSITPMMGVKSASKFKSIADHSRMDKVVEASRCQNPDMPGSGKPMIYMTTTEVKKCLTLKKSDPVPLIEDNDDNNNDDSGFFYLSDSDDDDLTSGSVLLGLQFSEDDQLNHSFILEDNPLNGPIDSTFDERIIQIDANLQDVDSLGQTILDERKRKKLMEDDSFSLEDNPLNGPIDSTFDGEIIQIDADLQDIDSLGQTILDERKRKKLMEDDSFSLEDNPLNGPIDSTFDGNLQGIDSLGQIVVERKRKKLMEENAIEVDAILEGIDLFVQILVERKKKKNELKKRVFICAILFCIVWFASCFVGGSNDNFKWRTEIHLQYCF
jgi:ribosome-associated protein YbcJ (S4-like RNA binding protein)